MQNNLVSIAMATYNGEKYLREQLDSIYNQTYKNIEVIVCDDCSSDKTIKILDEYKEKYCLQYYINEKNLGYVKNFEKAISLCNGEYIALSDQDDIWLENKLEILLEEIGTSLLIHSDCKIIDESGNIISNDWKGKINSHLIMEDFLFSNVVTGCTVLMSKELKEVALPFPDGLAYHDWYLAILAAKEKKIKYLNKSLINYRQHSNQDTGAGKNKSLYDSIIRTKFDRLFGKKTYRLKAAEKQIRNLKSIEEESVFKNKSYIIKDFINYYDDYIKNFIHIKAFFISIKYHKNFYHTKNKFFIKNIIKDLLG